MVAPEGPHYRFLARIGAGGFGEVYHAHKVAPGGFRKDVALKVLSADKADVEEVVSRLKDEARVLALLNHRAIVKVDLLVRLSGRWTVVMEYVEGADLERVLARQGPLPPFVALEIGAEVSSALDYAWNHEVMDPTDPAASSRPLHLLHRDIKPSNIQLTPHGDVKVLDFGIARAEFDSREARTGDRLLFTQSYAAPERLKGVEHPSGDIYSLGATLCELLTGQRLDLLGPYMTALLAQDRGFQLELYLANRYAELRAELSASSGMTEALTELLLSMVAWEPEGRPAASELKRTFRRLAVLAQGRETLPEWCERVVRPFVDARRQGMAEPGPLESGPLTGKALISDGIPGLEPAETDVERPPVPGLRRPDSADSIEATRWQSLAPTMRVAQVSPSPASGGAEVAGQASGEETTPVATPRAPWPAVLLALLGLTVLIVALGPFLTPESSDHGAREPVAEASPSTPPAVEPAPEPLPAVAEPSDQELEAEPPPPEDVAEAPEPASGPVKPSATPRYSPPKVTPSRAAAAPKREVGQVRLSGAASSAQLRSSAGSVTVPAAGAKVAVGEYQVTVTLEDGRTLKDVMTLRVGLDEELNVFCPGWTPSCSLKP